MLGSVQMCVATRVATHTTIGQLVPLGDVQCWCGFWLVGATGLEPVTPSL